MSATADWLALLDYGTFEVAEDGRRIPIVGYAIGAGAETILVDTGFPEAYHDEMESAARRDGLDAFGRLVELEPRNRPEAQLALLGVEPKDITQLVITHGDIDHVGAIDRFPDATLVMSRAEREGGPPRYFGDVRPIRWPRAAYRIVDGDEELAAGVTLLATPGHSPGHLSLLVRLPETGSVILAVDAISRPNELETELNGGADDVDLARASARRLVEIADEAQALLVYGHDPEQRSRLCWAPDVYR